MRPCSLFLLALACATPFAPSHAVTHTHSGKISTHKKPATTTPAPQSIGKYGDWQAATHSEGGQTICYAFARVKSSEPAIAGRGDVVITVTERAKLRDTVAISAGFDYASGVEANVAVGARKFPFYTSGRSAFAHDGAAVIAAFGKGSEAVVTSPGPKNKNVTDHFSLNGFGAAMKTVLANCPDK